MKTQIIPLRLNPTELEQLDYLVKDKYGKNRGEVFRMLLAIEFCARKGLPKPSAVVWQSASRTKPRKVA